MSVDKTFRLVWLAAWLALITARSDALQIPSIFGNGMVLQREKPVVVWGWAQPGAKIEVEFAGKTTAAVADQFGRWEIQLPPMSAEAEGRSFLVRGEGTSRELKDVVVGDVWLLAGQSNMGWDVNQSEGGQEAKARAPYPWLRGFFQWPWQGASETPQRDVTGGEWLKGDPDVVGRFSAVGFYFAEALQRGFQGVPIGLIHTPMGGTAIEAWIDLPSLRATPCGRPGEEFFRKGVDLYKAKKAAWDAALLAWEKEAELAANEGKMKPALPDELRKEPEGIKPHMLPSALFNGKVHPLQPFAVRGVLWYQGESNATDAEASARYGGMLEALVTSWRRGWRDRQLPFIIIQLPGFEDAKKLSADWPALRAQQAGVSSRLEKTHLLVAADLGERDDIHPQRKKPLGERAALIARRHILGESDVICHGPELAAAVFNRDDNTIILSFVPPGRLVASRNGAVGHWDLAEENGPFAPVAAELRGNDIVLAVPAQSSGPYRVRYAWRNWIEGELKDADSGLPLAPFEIRVLQR